MRAEDIQPKTTEWVLGLYQYVKQFPDGDLFSRFNEMIRAILTEELKLEANYMAVEGPGYSGKLVSPNRLMKKLMASSFSGLSVLSYVVSATNEPGYDRLVSASLSYNQPNEILFCLAVNEGVAPFRNTAFRRSMQQGLKLSQWQYGLALKDQVEKQPEFHVLGLDNGKLSDDDRKSLIAWYRASFEERVAINECSYRLT